MRKTIVVSTTRTDFPPFFNKILKSYFINEAMSIPTTLFYQETFWEGVIVIKEF